ncbi:MAG: hypothetical protein ACOCSR_02770, partial [Wenzhouxiangella sp.]
HWVKTKRTFAIAIVAIVLLASANFIFYTVDGAEQAIIVQFGEPIGDMISEPVLKMERPWRHCKVPIPGIPTVRFLFAISMIGRVWCEDRPAPRD